MLPVQKRQGDHDMGDEQRPGTAQDTAAIVWNLAEGFALLAAQLADRYPAQQAKAIEAVLSRMAERTAEIGKADLAGKLDYARGRYADMFAWF
jgi:hypothetical protein